MNGADALIQTAAEAGVQVCFANPGTTELPVVVAIDRNTGLRAVLCLHETVATGAADGYGRMTGKPALTLLHLGPGLANGLANLHNAKRAKTPIVNLIGEHATWHATADAPLASDIDSIAAPVSDWQSRSRSGPTLGADMADAVAAAGQNAGQVATMILAHDHQIEEGAVPPALVKFTRQPQAVPEADVAAAAAALAKGDALLLLGNAGVSEAGLLAAGRLSQACGATLMSLTSNARAERGGDLPGFTKLPYFPEQAMAALEPYRTVVLAGAKPPVAFFGWPGYPSRYLSDQHQVVTLATPAQDVVGALEDLATLMKAPAYRAPPGPERPALPSGPLDPERLCAVVAALQPENAIVVDEALTSGWSYHRDSQGAPRFSQLSLTGGAIGIGPSLSVGAAVACPERQVINIEADGSGLYAVQALWTQAREGLKVVTVVCSNRRYNILEMEIRRAGHNALGAEASKLTSLEGIDWVSLSRGFGVPATSVESSEAFINAFRDALEHPGPSLIEAVLP